APFAEPGGHHLHAGRIDTGEEESSREAQPDSDSRPGRRESEHRVRDRREKRRRREDAPRSEYVRDVRERADERPGDESELDGEGQAARVRGGEAPARRESRCGRRSSEPERHPRELRESQKEESAPASHWE